VPFRPHSSPMRKAAIKASCGMLTEPYSRILFFPYFCFSSRSYFLAFLFACSLAVGLLRCGFFGPGGAARFAGGEAFGGLGFVDRGAGAILLERFLLR